MPGKVMVVDDSLTVRRQVSQTLGDAGFSIFEANDGADALAKLNGAPDIALMVLDVNMPVMGGLELLECIRGIPQYKALPVVMLTTEGQPALMQKAKSLGAKGWIIKPFRPEMLVAAVQKLTGQ